MVKKKRGHAFNACKRDRVQFSMLHTEIEMTDRNVQCVEYRSQQKSGCKKVDAAPVVLFLLTHSQRLIRLVFDPINSICSTYPSIYNLPEPQKTVLNRQAQTFSTQSYRIHQKFASSFYISQEEFVPRGQFLNLKWRNNSIK